ncbi:outer membrane protein assembly factor BamB family protein [Williamsia sterculiae]|uniref:Outer membrane protein assembly factor BamB, contains PQQ-like beta-propeller repeat n=1 Tax=Williamsia sterculiae TaxID=1344003 RepID=A0A1N7G3P1_9NOCA|nr:PQQ-binding-like beta-propeller repeat protein [Williamsia sterculiae]SIS07066.1 Outer membrane protein assembly factor BamB, contains PQQ-like beta-propeller repeat [Williamsia sterculiae]
MPSTVTRRWTHALVTAAVATLAISACSDGADDVSARASVGWSSWGGDAANSNFAYPTVASDVAVRWTRPTGGPISAPVTISGRSNVGVTSDTPSGCNVFYFDPRAGRKNFCTRMASGVELNAMLVDQSDNVYLGEPGRFLALNGSGIIRWRFPTIGAPLPAKFAGPGQVLLVTTQGQVVLFDAQTGDPIAPELDLYPGADPAKPAEGLGDCITGGPHCPIATSPAVDSAARRFYLNIWPKGSIASQVRALSYAPDKGGRTIREAWKSDIPGGVIGAPTLSADNKTLYVFGRLGSLYAIDAATGKPKWDQYIGGYGFGTMTVSPDGLIVPTPVLGGPLLALRDKGTKAEVAWRRDDLGVVGLSTATQSKTVWVPVRDKGGDALSLREVSAADGRDVRTVALPGSVGFVTGVSVSAAGQLATATNLGEVYFLDKPQAKTPTS